MGGVRGRLVTLGLCGDVMLGRGVDQILAHPGDPALQEPLVRDARTYVELAEAVNGPIPRLVGAGWPWGEALAVLTSRSVDVRVVNLETAITGSGEFAPGKTVHYRMNPANIDCLGVARPEVCGLANNHVLDFGRRGLAETLAALGRAGLPAAGAGPDDAWAWQPVTVPVRGGRVVVYCFAAAGSGVPAGWAAAADRAGVALLPELSPTTLGLVADRIRRAKRPGDVVVASVHWGSNWGYPVGTDQVRFGHGLIDAGADLVHGHSSHHPRPVELYRGKLVLHGCGDFIDDYEGITGHQQYRPDLRLLYLASVDPGTGTLARLRMIPLQARQMRLRHAAPADVDWLQQTLDRISRPYQASIHREPDGTLALHN
jgi:poly-gamma-glutamate synthesis protein (capsule biosynthesis protein)